MKKQITEINTIDEYLSYFIDKVNDVVFAKKFPQIKNRILHICVLLREQIEYIDRYNFFDCWARINNLEAQIFILLELSELMAKNEAIYLIESEAINMAETDSEMYFKERCGLTILDDLPYSLHFLQNYDNQIYNESISKEY